MFVGTHCRTGVLLPGRRLRVRIPGLISRDGLEDPTLHLQIFYPTTTPLTELFRAQSNTKVPDVTSR